MRRLLTTLTLISALMAGLLGFSLAPAAAVTGVDLAAKVTATPTEVSPPGGIVVYTATVSNESTTNHAAPLPARLSNQTNTKVNQIGTLDLVASRNLGGCTDGNGQPLAQGTPSPTVQCDFSLAFGESATIWVAIRTQAGVAGSLENVTTAGFTPGVLHSFIDENPSNDTASVETQVFNDPNQSTALLHEGESIAFKKHVLTVIDSDNGVIVSLKDAFGEGDACGTNFCGDGLHVGFFHNDYYQGTVRIDTNFGKKGAPCRDTANQKCDEENLYVRKVVNNQEVIFQMADCVSGTTQVVCQETEYKSDGAELHRVVRMESEDPDLLEPGSLPIKG